MSTSELPPLRSEMIALLGRIIGDKPLSPELQRTALDLFASLVAQPAEPSAFFAHTNVSAQFVGAAPEASPTSVGNRRLVNVHGICHHAAGFSDPWWDALRPYASTVFGTGTLGQTRLEVIWSDIVNQAAAALTAMAGPAAALSPHEVSRATAAEEIKEALRDRADQELVNAAMGTANAFDAPVAAGEPGAMFELPVVRCVDDFSIYLTDDGVRQQIINRFIAVVQPEFQANRQLDIVGHSWGSVVAYEGLRQLEDQGFHQPLVRNFFTVGAALSIGPVKRRLRPANRDGKKPASVQRWVNLDARGDVVGGPLKNRPYQVDFDLVNLDPFGCGSVFGVVNPRCAHSSYFQTGNVAVNKEVFGKYIAT
jgi:hypothetical protein